MNLLYRSLLGAAVLAAISFPSLAQTLTNLIVTSPASDTPGTNNTIIGIGAGNQTMTGNSNLFVGYISGRANTTGENNVFVGAYAGVLNKTGRHNTFVGNTSGRSNQTGIGNTFIGYQSGTENTTGIGNTTVGWRAGDNNISGDGNSFFGRDAGGENTTGSRNTAMGSQAGTLNLTGSLNTYLGYAAGYSQRLGLNNVVVGAYANSSNYDGSYIVAVGDSAGYNNKASGNVFLGSKSGQANTTGTNNTFLGKQAGQNVTTGSNNVIIGPGSGVNITDGSDNVLLGYNSQAADKLQNATAIGAGSMVAVSNAVVLGNKANVGIGTNAPTTRLEVVSDNTNDSGLRLTKLTASSQTTRSTDQFLTVNEKGDVVKARYRLAYSSAAEWADKVFEVNYRLAPLAEVADFIRTRKHLPGIPSATEVVQQGVDVATMNAKLLEKVEELTLYSIEQQKEIDELKKLVKQLLERK